MNRKGRFNERLKEAIGASSVRAFSQLCSVSGSVLRAYLAGKSEPTRPALINMAKTAGVNIAWLADNEGLMRPEDAQAAQMAPVAIDVELMGQIMTIFMQAAHDNQTTLPAKDIGNMAARAYQDILTDFPDPTNRQKALAQLTNIATNIAKLCR